MLAPAALVGAALLGLENAREQLLVRLLGLVLGALRGLGLLFLGLLLLGVLLLRVLLLGVLLLGFLLLRVLLLGILRILGLLLLLLVLLPALLLILLPALLLILLLLLLLVLLLLLLLLLLLVLLRRVEQFSDAEHVGERGLGVGAPILGKDAVGRGRRRAQEQVRAAGFVAEPLDLLRDRRGLCPRIPFGGRDLVEHRSRLPRWGSWRAKRA